MHRSCRNAVVHIQGHCVALVLHKKKVERVKPARIKPMRTVYKHTVEEEKAVVKPLRLSRNINVQLVIKFTKGLYLKRQK